MGAVGGAVTKSAAPDDSAPAGEPGLLSPITDHQSLRLAIDILLSLQPNLLPASTLINLVLRIWRPIKICVLREGGIQIKKDIYMT